MVSSRGFGRESQMWGLVLLACAAVGAAYDESIFSSANNYPRVWYTLLKGDIPTVANNGLILRQNSITPNDFAQNVVLGLANGQRNQASAGVRAPPGGWASIEGVGRWAWRWAGL